MEGVNFALAGDRVSFEVSLAALLLNGLNLRANVLVLAKDIVGR